MDIQTMHDWILEKIEINWTLGSALFALRFRGERYIVVAKDFTKCEVTLEDFWGPSVSILEAVGPAKCGKSTIFSLEMQSGDLLRIEALSNEVKHFLPSDDGRLAKSVAISSKVSEIFFAIEWESKSMTSSFSLDVSSKELRRIRLSKHQQQAISNEICTVYPWLMFGSKRRIKIIETKSGDRIEIEESIE